MQSTVQANSHDESTQLLRTTSGLVKNGGSGRHARNHCPGQPCQVRAQPFAGHWDLLESTLAMNFSLAFLPLRVDINESLKIVLLLSSGGTEFKSCLLCTSGIWAPVARLYRTIFVPYSAAAVGCRRKIHLGPDLATVSPRQEEKPYLNLLRSQCVTTCLFVGILYWLSRTILRNEQLHRTVAVLDMECNGNCFFGGGKKILSIKSPVHPATGSLNITIYDSLMSSASLESCGGGSLSYYVTGQHRTKVASVGTKLWGSITSNCKSMVREG